MGGTQQTAKIFIDGDSNMVYSWLHGTGDYTVEQTSLASLNADQYNSYIYITGNSNYISQSRVKNTSKTRLIVTGDSNKITEYNDRDDWLLNGDGTIYIDVNGDNNLIGAKIQGYAANGTSVITIDLDGDDAQIDVNQHGGGNTAEIKVYGSSSYDFVLDLHQSANHTFTFCFNRAHQNANYSGDFDSLRTIIVRVGTVVQYTVRVLQLIAYEMVMDTLTCTYHSVCRCRFNRTR